MDKHRRLVLALKSIAVLIVLYRALFSAPLDDEITRIQYIGDWKIKWSEGTFNWLTEGHPPLLYLTHYYLSLVIGGNLLLFRLISIIPFFFIIYLCEKLVSKYIEDDNFKVLFWVLFASNPLQLLWYPFAKNYCLLSLMVLLIIYFLDKIKETDNESYYAYLFVTLSISTYMHMLMSWLYVSVFISSIPMIRSNKRMFVKIVVVLFLATLLALPNVMHASGISWAREFPIKSYLVNFGMIPFLAVAGETVLPWIWIVTVMATLAVLVPVGLSFVTIKKKELGFVVSGLLLTVGFAYTTFRFDGHVLGRYVLLTIPWFLICLTVVLSRIKRYLVVLIVSCLVLTTAVSNFNLFTCRGYWKASLCDDWSEVSAYIKSRSENKKVLVVSSSTVFNHYAEDDPQFTIIKSSHYEWRDGRLDLHISKLSNNYRYVAYVQMLTPEYIYLEEPFLDNIKHLLSDKFSRCDEQFVLRDPDFAEKKRFIRESYPEFRVRVLIFSR